MRSLASARVLVTGFEPFGGDATNPSASVALALHGQRLDLGAVKVDIQGVVLPCVFEGALHALRQALKSVQPSVALSLGLAGDRIGLSFERVALNLVDARIPDNAGAQPVDVRVVPRSSRAACFSTLPVKAMCAAVHAQGLPASLSLSAGTYVCNAVMFALLHEAARDARRGHVMRAGFCHLPRDTTMVPHHIGVAPMPIEDMVRGVRVALSVAVSTTQDIKSLGGEIA
jgi:pyroglutamyl-peptidase